MNNKIDFPVSCPKNPSRKETIRVYYVHHEGKPFPLPPNYCDNADGSDICQKCNADILAKALNTQPPFFR